MSPLSVRLLRLSLGCLIAGATIGAWRLGLGLPDDPSRHGLRTLHQLLLLEGWLLPFVLGTAHWMLPKHPGAAPRGEEWVGSVGLTCYALGLLLGAAALWPDAPAPLGELGAGCRLAGLGLMLRLLWPRIKPFGKGRALPPSTLPRR